MTYCLPRQLQIREETKNLVSRTRKQQLELGCRENIRERQWTNSWSRGVGVRCFRFYFWLGPAISILFALASLPQDGKWGCLRLPRGAGSSLLRPRLSNLILWIMLSWPQLRSSLLCCLHLLHLPLRCAFPGPCRAYGAESQHPMSGLSPGGTLLRTLRPGAFHQSVWRAKSHALCKVSPWAMWAICRTSKARWLQLWPSYEALPLLSELKMLSWGTGARYDPAPLPLHLMSAQLHLWDLSDYQLSPPCLALNERVCKAAGAFSLLHSLENP